MYALGEILDGEDKIFLRATLESSDADQRLFAEQYPAETAKGFRRFSLDGYRDTETNSEGQRTQTHYTYKYFVGLPPYATLREKFLQIATGEAILRSSTTNLVA